MDKRLWHLLKLFALMVLSITLTIACSMNSSQVSHDESIRHDISECRVVQHEMGESCIPLNPQRIVTLRDEYYINGLALGVKPIATTYVAGFPTPKYFQGKLGEIQYVGDFKNPNLEAILRLKPDLILAGSNSKSIYSQLSYIAPTVLLKVSFPPIPWQEQLGELARILGKEKMGEQLIGEYSQRVEKLKQALGDRRTTLQVSVANSAAEYGIWAYGEAHFSGTSLNDIGLQRPSTQKREIFYTDTISQEKLFEIDGDVLFMVSWERTEDTAITAFVAIALQGGVHQAIVSTSS